MSAKENEPLVHSMTPVVKDNGVYTQVINISSQPQSGLVCGEAVKVDTNKRYHLGCTPIDLNSTRVHEWGKRMTVYLNDAMPAGTYSVYYTYRLSDGIWHRMTHIDSGKVAYTTITKTSMGTTVSGTKMVTNKPVRHSYTPQAFQAKKDVYPTNGVSSRVTNFSDSSVKVTLCAEARGNGKKWHLGCIPEKVELNKIWSEGSSINMNVYARSDMPSGTYMVWYTYQDEAGNWHEVVSPDTGRPMRTVLTV